MPSTYLTDTRPRLESATPSHLTVSAVVQMAKVVVRQAFPDPLWIKGEVSEFRQSKGSYHLELIEHRADRRNIVLNAAIWNCLGSA